LLRHSSSSYVTDNVFIDEDLSPTCIAVRLAFEARKRRLEASHHSQLLQLGVRAGAAPYSMMAGAVVTVALPVHAVASTLSWFKTLMLDCMGQVIDG